MPTFPVIFFFSENASVYKNLKCTKHTVQCLDLVQIIDKNGQKEGEGNLTMNNGLQSSDPGKSMNSIPETITDTHVSYKTKMTLGCTFFFPLIDSQCVYL